MRGASLPRIVVGIDLETTALEPAAGDIIEVAAIRFDVTSGKELARFERLCSPRQPLSPDIIAITGITQQMVDGRVPFASIRSELQEFIGNDLLFAHNASFDLDWLAYHGLTLSNKTWDTFLLAAAAWPTAASYNLGTLAEEQGVVVVGEHRAAGDVVVTWQLLRRIQQELRVPGQWYEHIINALNRSGQGHYAGLFLPLKKPASTQLATDQTRQAVTPPLVPASLPVSPAKLLAADGPLAQHLEGFSYRQVQVDMAAAVTRTINEQQISFIEAGTGIGKTLAYLVPALLYACRGQPGAPVIISTYTRHLQDQIVQSDLPKLMAALGVRCQTAVLKGRSNYICPRQLRAILRHQTLTSDTAWVLIKIFVWLSRGGDGDIEQLNFSHQAATVLRRITASSLSCRLHCRSAADCPYQLARRRAWSAHLVVVNHALLLQLMTAGDEHWRGAAVIVDEAHHLEDSARSTATIDYTAERIGELSPAFAKLAGGLPAGQQRRRAVAEAKELATDFQKILAAVADFFSYFPDQQQVRLSAAVRRSRRWQGVAKRAKQWHNRLRFLIGWWRGLAGQYTGSQELYEETLRSADELQRQWGRVLSGEQERVQWVQWQSAKSRQAMIADTVINTGVVVRPLFAMASSCVLTSATLTVNGTYDYIKRQLGLTKAEEYIFPTVYDYRRHMLIYIADDGPYPTDTDFEQFVTEVIERMANVLHGRILALFTAIQSVRNLYHGLIRSLNKGPIKVYAQNITGGRRNITLRFQKRPESVLLGTVSFWEGVDIPGDTLSAVVIPKLPFPHVSDPILGAIIDQHGKDWAFEHHIIPQMILRLRQGVGRLIRSDHDRGVVVILDRRIITQPYGRLVMTSLPPAQIQIGPTAELVSHLRRWFGSRVLERWREAAEQSSGSAGSDGKTTV